MVWLVWGGVRGVGVDDGQIEHQKFVKIIIIFVIKVFFVVAGENKEKRGGAEGFTFEDLYVDSLVERN